MSPRVQQLVNRFVHSVEQIEILCLLSQNPEKAWTTTEVFRQIQSSEKSVSEHLQRFLQEGLLTSENPNTYRLSPKNAEFTATISELCSDYRQRRVSVIETIYQKQPEAIQSFADAFKLRKDK